MTAWDEYKKRRATDLQSGAPVRPTDLLNNENYISEEVASNRMSICSECPRLIKFTHQCKECGCFMKLKTKLKTASCPLGKW